MILNHPTLSESEVKLLVTAADSVYQNQMSLDGWNVITPELTNPDYGLDPQLVTGNTYIVETGSLNLPFVDLPYGDANAALLKSGDNLLLAFRDAQIPEGGEDYWLRLREHYDLFLNKLDISCFNCLIKFSCVNRTTTVIIPIIIDNGFATMLVNKIATLGL